MKRYLFILFSTAFAIWLSGCAIDQQVLHSQTDKYFSAPIPTSYSEKNKVEAPMTPEEYKKMSREEQADYSITYLTKVYEALGHCYQDKLSTMEAINEQSKIPDKVNKLPGENGGTKPTN